MDTENKIKYNMKLIKSKKEKIITINNQISSLSKLNKIEEYMIEKSFKRYKKNSR